MITEFPKDAELIVERIQKLTGAEQEIVVKKLYEDLAAMPLTFQLFIIGNYFPSIENAGPMARRVLLLPLLT